MRTLLLLLIAVLLNRTNAQDLVEYRYWLNDDVSTLTTVTVPAAPDANIIGALDLPGNPGNYDRITLQFKDSEGRSSVPYTTTFVRTGKDVTGYEYWIDDAIADRQSASCGPAQIVDLITDLPTGTSSGAHTITLRFRDVDAGWSIPLVTAFDFLTGIAELPGVSNILLFPNPANEQLTVRLDSEGEHTLKVSLVDASGRTVIPESGMASGARSTIHRDISTLASGSYFLRIVDGEHETSLPFVKR